MADQAFISLANFLTMLILARELSVSAFGQFVLVNTGLQVVLSFQGPLITQPHNVLAFRHGMENYRSYTTSCLYAQLAFGLLTLLLFLIVSGGISYVDDTAGKLVLAMAFAAMAWQTQEFFRRVMYTEERPSGAFLNDIVSYGAQVFLIVVLLVTGILDAFTAIISIAITSSIASVVGYFQTRSSFDGKFRFEYVKSNWNHSRWLVGAAGSSLINRHLWYYLLALLSGASATATFAAVSILLRPVGILVTSIEAMLPTRLARQLSTTARLQGLSAHRPAFLLAPIIALYSVGIVLTGDRVLGLLYGDSYRGETLLILLLALFYGLSYVQTILDSTLRALDRTRPIFTASVIAAVLTLTVGWGLTGLLSEEGAALGVILNALVGMYVVGRRVREEIA